MYIYARIEPTFLEVKIDASSLFEWSCLSYISKRHFLLNVTGDPSWPSGYNAWFPKVRVVAVSRSGLSWLLYECAVLWRSVYGPSATERPLGIICEEKGIFSLPGFYFIAIWPKLFLPSLLPLQDVTRWFQCFFLFQTLTSA